MPHEPTSPNVPPASQAQQEQLRRLEKALAEGRARREAVEEAWVRRTGRLPSRKERRRWEKQWHREAKREAKRAEREALGLPERQPVRGAVYLTVAFACLMMALRLPGQFWWLIFVALSFALSGAKHLSRPERQPEAPREPTPVSAPASVPLPAAPEPAPAADPRLARVDAVCDKLLGELRDAPEVLREVVHAPERTVQALREGCHTLVRRERELRALVTEEESRRLETERERLAARLEAEGDAVVRERLKGALEALDEQRRQRAELVTAADRLEAEHTRLTYTLENLYAQVLRVRSADTGGSDVAGAGLRRSVEQLGTEVQAVTEALEEAHGATPDGRVRTR